MTKKLEELLNLPSSKEIIEKEDEENKPSRKEKFALDEVDKTIRDIAEFDKIAAALPAVHGLGRMADEELNEVANKAMQAFDDLMDLGMNVEARYSGRIFEVAGGMLKTSLDAKVAKLDKKLKMVDLQLKKQKVDQESVTDSKFTEGSGFVVTDRNSLLEKLKDASKDK